MCQVLCLSLTSQGKGITGLTSLHSPASRGHRPLSVWQRKFPPSRYLCLFHQTRFSLILPPDPRSAMLTAAQSTGPIAQPHNAPLHHPFPPPVLMAHPKEDLELACQTSASCFYFSLPGTKLGEARASTSSPRTALNSSENQPHSCSCVQIKACLKLPISPRRCTPRSCLSSGPVS